jgi:hypothetical protein
MDNQYLLIDRDGLRWGVEGLLILIILDFCFVRYPQTPKKGHMGPSSMCWMCKLNRRAALSPLLGIVLSKESFEQGKSSFLLFL